MELKYTDLQGIKHDLKIHQDTTGRQRYFRIYRDGMYFMDITKRDSGGWEELYNGPSDRADEYGRFIDSIP